MYFTTWTLKESEAALNDRWAAKNQNSTEKIATYLYTHLEMERR